MTQMTRANGWLDRKTIVRQRAREYFHIKRTFTFVINLLYSWPFWTDNDPKPRSESAYACHQLKRALFLVNEVYPKNAEPLPFCFMNHYNAPFIFQFKDSMLKRIEYSHESSKRSRFPSEVITIFRFRNPKVTSCDSDHNDLQRDRNRRRTRKRASAEQAGNNSHPHHSIHSLFIWTYQLSTRICRLLRVIILCVKINIRIYLYWYELYWLKREKDYKRKYINIY